uniref:ABC transporter domain-containing protein n=1 Tax=Panagrolaimus davidi TaxID=227884 RepID=A0A914QAR5_9BILA
MLTSIFATIVIANAVYLGHKGLITAGIVGLVTTTATMIRTILGEIAKSIKELEMNIVAVERIEEYVQNEQEAEWTSKIPPPASWPSKGVIEFKNFSLRYRPSTPLVLKNLNLKILSNQKIGIVGRTGAGKTSLTMALFRMIEPASGTIYIDNVDFRTLGLHELRNALTIIPQDPVLFCGNLRINLDPFNEYTDEILWDAIEKAHLKQFVDLFPQKLEHEISEGGGNLSVGQRQLICLARAILRNKTKILVLDEATAAVDAETDQLIQDSIRKHFSHCTILTIAHRLNTVMDYDKILVMDNGEIHEFDSPEKLLQNKNGIFYSLAFQAKLI